MWTVYPDAFRQKEEQLKEVITKALQTWLQPLRERYPNRQFTNDFLLIKQPDVVACEEDRLALRELDTRITFDCMENPIMSFARIAPAGEAPDICLRKGAAAGPDDQGFIFVLVHELGHAFGLNDTYVRGVNKSTGGLAFTFGKQPASVMAGARVLNFHDVIFSPLQTNTPRWLRRCFRVILQRSRLASHSLRLMALLPNTHLLQRRE